jgi:hypothetical protein
MNIKLSVLIERPTLCFILFFILYPKIILSQSIQGKVIDSVSKEAIEFAFVVVNDSINLITGADGSFVVKGLQKKLKTALGFQMLGYQSRSIQFRFRSDTTLTIEMKEVPIVLQDVLVKERRQKPLKAEEIVSMAIDSVNKKAKNDFKHTVSGFYSQTHYSIPLLNWGQEDHLPNLDTAKTYHRLIQANLLVSYNSTITNTSIINVRRSKDFRQYKHGYRRGKGRAMSLEYVSTGGGEERLKATEREKKLYDINGFFTIDPIANHTAKVVPEEKFYLKSGTYGYLNDDFTKHHTFKLEGVIDYGDEKVAKIKILPSARSYVHGSLGRHHWIPVGYLFIRLRDFGIMRMDYSYILNPKKKDFDAWMGRALTGLPILFSDVIIYKQIEDKLVLAYLSRFQSDIDVSKGGENPKKMRYYFMEREFVASRYNAEADPKQHTLSSIYDPYKYDPLYWEKAGIKSIGFKNYVRMVNDLESNGESLGDQFKGNSK